jgi:photosystem II stability/assembly factor-like uncharacterized protein
MSKLLFLCLLLTELLYSQYEWEKINGPFGGSTGRIFAKGDTILTAVNRSIYFSTNNGSSWQMSSSISSYNFIDFTYSNDTTFFCLTSNGIFKSNDFRNWSLVKSGTLRSLGRDIYGNLYAVSGTSMIDTHGMLYSDNNGTTWRYIDFPGELYFPSFLNLQQYIFVAGKGKIYRKDVVNNSLWEILHLQFTNNIKMTGTDSGVLYVVSGGSKLIAHSTDYGVNWNYINLGDHYPDVSIEGIAFKNNIIIVLSSGSFPLYRSTDNGITWIASVNNLPGGDIGSIITSNENFLISTYGSGIFKSIDGEEWSGINNGISEVNFNGLARIRKSIIGATWGLGVLKFDDEFKRWEEMNEGLTSHKTGALLQSSDYTLYLSAIDGLYKRGIYDIEWKRITSLDRRYWYIYIDHYDRIFAHNQFNVYVSSDHGDTWNSILNGMSLSAVSVSPKGYLFVSALNPPRLYRSTNDGVTWNIVHQNESSFKPPIAGKEGVLFIAVASGILKSMDQGTTWQLYPVSFTNKYAQRMYTDNNGKYFIATQDQGLYFSDDECKNWSSVSGNLSGSTVWDILFTENQVILGSSRGIWKNKTGVLVSSDEKSYSNSYALFQNYPNPFNPSTTIKYMLGKPGRVTISIYDILGKEVIKLIDEDKPGGEFQVNWNGSSYPSGIYFLKMESEDFRETKKIILIK